MVRPPALTVPLAALLIGLSACASKEDRVRSALLDFGLAPRTAACLATPLARDLSSDQLRKLGNLASLARTDPRTISIALLTDKLRSLDDPAILRVTARAAIDCTLLL